MDLVNLGFLLIPILKELRISVGTQMGGLVDHGAIPQQIQVKWNGIIVTFPDVVSV